MLLARLGLRGGEAAALALDDIDWHRGEIMVRGKGGRRDRLPLPGDVGEALVAYLRDGRPAVAGCRTLFLRVRAPMGALGTRGVADVVRLAAGDVGPPAFGPHRLRHSAATAMLRNGASLTEVGQVLRQARAATTAIYAKVDRAALRALAQPWPGEAPWNALRQAAEDYLAVRRALGSKLPGYDRLLAGFAAYLEAAGAATVTTELALAWARLPGEDAAHPAYLGKRLCVARGFARHLQAFDPATEIPAARLLPSRPCRAVPYLYSEADIAALMRAACCALPCAPPPSRR